MRTGNLLVVLLCLAAVAMPTAVSAQFGGAVHNGGWANGTGVLLPPRLATNAPVPILLALLPQTSYTAGGSNAFAYLYLNAPVSEARARIRIIRLSDSTVIATSAWTSTLTNRVTIAGLVVGTTYRVEVELEALTAAWLSVPWATLVASYVQPGKDDPPFDYDLQG